MQHSLYDIDATNISPLMFNLENIYIKGSEFVFESRLHSKMDMKMKWHIEDPRVLRRLTKDDWKVDV